MRALSDKVLVIYTIGNVILLHFEIGDM